MSHPSQPKHPAKKPEPISDSVRLALIERRVANIEKAVKSTSFWIKVKHIVSILFTLFIVGFLIYAAAQMKKQIEPALELIKESRGQLDNFGNLMDQGSSKLDDINVMLDSY